MAVDEANEHVISLWDWQKGDKGQKVTETKVSTKLIVCNTINPHTGFFNITVFL